MGCSNAEDDPPCTGEPGTFPAHKRLAFSTTIIPDNRDAVSIEENVPDILRCEPLISFVGFENNTVSATPAYDDLVAGHVNHRTFATVVIVKKYLWRGRELANPPVLLIV